MTEINPPIAFCWTDLETTGLKPRGGSILEIGCILTDKNLNEKARFQSLVIPEGFDGTVESLGMDPSDKNDEYVINMHTENGLFDALRNAMEQADARELLSIEAVTGRFTKFLRGYGLSEDNKRWFDRENPNAQTKPYLAGSTVGFDKSWMEEHMAESLDLLHYRVYDVSTLKTAAEFYRPEIRWESAGAHRGMDDIVESIEHARILRDQMILNHPATMVVSGDSNMVASGDLTVNNVS